MMRQDPTVLIAGAGPTGLVLAAWLKHAGVQVRIVDKAPAPGTASRALAVHARTLEFYRQLGLAEKVIAGGIRAEAIDVKLYGRDKAQIPFGDFGKGMSPYPYVLIYPQDAHEALLTGHLSSLGVAVERGTEIIDYTQKDGGVVVHLKKGGIEESCMVHYLCGCDGASSLVRERLGTGFPGGTYERMFYVADVAIAGTPVSHLQACLERDDLCLVFPLKNGNVRLVGIVPEAVGKPREDIRYDDVATHVAQATRLEVTKVHWFSTYHVHHRVTRHFGKDRVFLLGDAAHIHSPAGGQGMNTGIGDAVNLGWKLAAVLTQKAPASLLDSYEIERQAFANRLVQSTDRLFEAMVGRSARSRFLRMWLVPNLGPLLMRIPFVRRLMFRTISQIGIHYQHSPISSGKAGKLQAGDRLPWLEEADNFAPLQSLAWQVHLYGGGSEEIATLCDEKRIPRHVFAWSRKARHAGFVEQMGYLIRPDGYIACIGDAPSLRNYVEAHSFIGPSVKTMNSVPVPDFLDDRVRVAT